MNIQKIKQLCALLIASLIFASVPALSAPSKAKREVKKMNVVRANTIVIRCPDPVKAIITDATEGIWSRGTVLVKWTSAKFSAGADGNDPRLYCNYNVSKDKDLQLIRVFQGRYDCKQLPDPKAFQCKSFPPIKIGGNKGD